MGSTNTQGNGLGSASGSNKGSDHVSMSVKKLIGPKVVAAGSVTLASNVATIQVPVLSSSTGDYVIMATARNASTVGAVIVTAFTIATNTVTQPSTNMYAPAGDVTTTSYDATIAFKGGNASDVVNYIVVTSGVA